MIDSVQLSSLKIMRLTLATQLALILPSIHDYFTPRDSTNKLNARSRGVSQAFGTGGRINFRYSCGAARYTHEISISRIEILVPIEIERTRPASGAARRGTAPIGKSSRRERTGIVSLFCGWTLQPDSPYLRVPAVRMYSHFGPGV